jgi:hypothetical protein
MKTYLYRTLGCLLAVTCVASAGCESLGLGGGTQGDTSRRRTDRTTTTTRRDSDRYDSDRYDSRGDDTVIGGRRGGRGERSGSSGRGLASIPRRAEQVDEGDGRVVEYRPSRSGTIYAYDVDNDRVVYTGSIRADERFVLNPGENRASLGGEQISVSNLSARSRYRLYFDPQ